MTFLLIVLIVLVILNYSLLFLSSFSLLIVFNPHSKSLTPLPLFSIIILNHALFTPPSLSLIFKQVLNYSLYPPSLFNRYFNSLFFSIVVINRALFSLVLSLFHFSIIVPIQMYSPLLFLFSPLSPEERSKIRQLKRNDRKFYDPITKIDDQRLNYL